MVRAKFICNVIKRQHGYGETIELVAVSGPNNKSWSQWTPCGTISMQISNPDAAGQFTLGEHYFVDFSPAPAKEADESKSAA